MHNVLKWFQLTQELVFELFQLNQLTIQADRRLSNNIGLETIDRRHEHRDAVYQHCLLDAGVVSKNRNLG